MPFSILYSVSIQDSKFIRWALTLGFGIVFDMKKRLTWAGMTHYKHYKCILVFFNKPRTENVFKSKIQLDLPFIMPDLLHKFQMICIRRMQVIEWRGNARLMVGWKYRLFCGNNTLNNKFVFIVRTVLSFLYKESATINLKI